MNGVLSKKRFDYRHIICLLITLGFLACTAFIFPNALGRLIEAGRDFGLSVAFYFCELFGLADAIVPTVNSLPKTPFFPSLTPPSGSIAPSTTIPDTFVEFQSQWAAYWTTWASMDNFFDYLFLLVRVFFILSRSILIVVPFIIVVVIAFKSYFSKVNNSYNKDSRPLKVYKLVSQRTIVPAKKWISEFCFFVKQHRSYLIIWLCIWAFNFNFFTITLEFLAYWFYLTITFDFINIYRQVYKLALDLSAMFRFVPWWAWVLLTAYVFNKVRKRVGYAWLNHLEGRNQTFIHSLPICILIKGVMNAGKTKFLTDIGISLENMFRRDAKNLIYQNDLKFPHFPWINFERELNRAIRYGEIYNLVSIREFVRKKSARFQKLPGREKCFDYDFERYGLNYDDNLKNNSLFDVLETYGQLYYIYTISNPLVLSNYSTRYDDVLVDAGNFPEWDMTIFERSSTESEAYTSYSHILDYDMLRLGRKVEKNNEYANAFEFGVVLLTEGGKERGNQFDTNEEKRKSDETNRKNDMFNQYLKLIRSASTVDYVPFVRVFMDEQRFQSLNADNRELCDIINIKDVKPKRLTMPFFGFESFLYDVVFSRFFRLYYKYRFNRSDNTLFLHFLKYVVSKISNHYDRIFNTFGYEKYKVETQRGDLEGNVKKQEYFLMSKKIYSNRYCTDVFGSYFEEKAKKSKCGLNDIPTYSGLRATDEEIKRQHSFFFSELEKYSLEDTAVNEEYARRNMAETEAETLRKEAERKLRLK